MERSFPLVVSMNEAARLASVSRSTVYRWAKMPGFPAIKIGGCTRVVVDDLVNWVKAQPRGGDVE